jgi:hypothetical protein
LAKGSKNHEFTKGTKNDERQVGSITMKIQTLSFLSLVPFVPLVVQIVFLYGVSFSPVRAGVLSFSAPQRLATLHWCQGAHPGVPEKGPEWMVVDKHGRFWLESDLDFGLYAPNGRYLQTISPLDKLMNFYGFAAMEALPDGRIVLLERMESRLEQSSKDNFELRSKPGARLVVLKADGKVERDKEEVDALQPHSDYYTENGGVYSIHDDGTYQLLDSIGPPPKDKAFGNFASIAFNSERWQTHVSRLPVFRSESRGYHDINGNLHLDKGVNAYLMGHFFVEGTGPLAERNGKIYYQVVCFDHAVFTNSVFVEDSARKKYILVELMASDKEPERVHGHALFVDEKGNLFEGVAQRDGYRIYEWKILP